MSTLTDFFGVTSGNPYFVTGFSPPGTPEAVPLTIADAVGAPDLAHLDPGALAAVEQLAVIPSAAERWLVEAVLPGPAASAVDALVVAEERGLLAVTRDGVALTRADPARGGRHHAGRPGRVAANRRVLGRRSWTGPMPSSPGWSTTPDQAGDRDAVLTHGPRAAAEAIAAGAHRQAVAAHLASRPRPRSGPQSPTPRPTCGKLRRRELYRRRTVGGGPSRRSCAPWCSVARGQHLPRRLAALAVPDRLVGGAPGDRRRRAELRPSERLTGTR